MINTYLKKLFLNVSELKFVLLIQFKIASLYSIYFISFNFSFIHL